MGKVPNNYGQPLYFLNDVYIILPPLPPASLPRPSAVSMMQAILHHRLKKKPPPSIMAFTQFDFYQYSVMGRWMLSNYNHATSVFWRAVSKKRTGGEGRKKSKSKMNVQPSLCLFLQGLTTFLSLSSPLSPLVAVRYERKKKRGTMKGKLTRWKAALCSPEKIFSGERKNARRL